jgi:hypothetical protein
MTSIKTFIKITTLRDAKQWQITAGQLQAPNNSVAIRHGGRTNELPSSRFDR